MKSRCREHLRVMYKQVLGGRGQGMKSCLANTRDQPHGMCVGQSWAGIATRSRDMAEAFGSEQGGDEDANVAQHFQVVACDWGCCMGTATWKLRHNG